MMNETNNNMDGVGTLGEVPFDDLAEIIPQMSRLSWKEIMHRPRLRLWA